MNITLSFDEQQMMLLNRALIKLRYKDAAPLIENINQQIAKQPDNVKAQTKWCAGDAEPE